MRLRGWSPGGGEISAIVHSTHAQTYPIALARQEVAKLLVDVLPERRFVNPITDVVSSPSISVLCGQAKAMAKRDKMLGI